GGSALRQSVDIGLDIIEVDIACRLRPLLGSGVTIGKAGNFTGLAKAIACCRITGTDLEQANTLLLAIEVVHQRVEQTTPEAGTHHAHIAGDRILQPDRRRATVEVAFPVLVDETVADNFLIAT